ncbi:MAG TPA: serine/threonine-protein kinase [Gemmatimonadaceae bacterium]|nr:serine/threonine-protein kinase [Gemmatimonadaceae bacterium]
MNAPAKTCPQCGQTYDFEQRFCPRDGSTLRSPEGSNLVGSVLAGRYHIVRRIGEGGMGQVYLAEHVRMRRRSAVKVLNQGLVNDSDAIARFNREASNASQIQHPNVAAIYDFGETDDGLIYLAMEYVDGEPLRKVIERQGALSAAEAAEITRQVADALEAAHEMGIVHRDLKPDNIMIARGRNGADLAKVVDFGIAKATSGDDQKVTRTGLAIGTPEYMSPEQLSGDAVDARSDIYSLGLVAFNMLTGQLPFPTDSSREAMIARLSERPRTLAEIKDDVEWPAELQTVMNRALASEPRDRYEHAGKFGRDLVRAVADMPESALTSSGTLDMPIPQLGTRLVERPGSRAGASKPASKAASASAPPSAPASALAATPAAQGDAELAAATRPPDRSPPLIPVEPAEGDDVGRFILKTFLVLAILAGGGGAWYVIHSRAKAAGLAASSPAATAPTALAATDSTHHDSVSPSPSSSPSSPSSTSSALSPSTRPAPRSEGAAAKSPPVTAGAADSTATATAGATTPATPATRAAPRAAPPVAAADSAAEQSVDSSAPAPADLDSVLAPIRDNISVGRARMGDGEYEGAQVRFAQASDQIRQLGRQYTALFAVATLRHDLSQAIDANRRACRAEKQLDERRGQTGPDCP